MGTFLKYLFYLILIIVIYLVGKGIYDGTIDKQTTVGSVVNQVDAGAEQIAKDAGNAIDNAVDSAKNRNATPPAASTTGPSVNPTGVAN